MVTPSPQFRRALRVLVLLTCVVLSSAARSETPVEALNPALPTLFIAGDSTAAPGPSPDQEGWGVHLPAYFDASKINIANRSRGGRSSRTFVTEGHWDKLLAELKAGDVVLVQFGHNDAGALNQEPPGSTRPLRARGTIPGVGEESEEIDNVITGLHETVHSFGWYLRKMIADVRQKGATPILLSLTARDRWTEGRLDCKPGGYREWDAEVARAMNVPFVDLTRILSDLYQPLGSEAVGKLFVADGLHTSPVGAEFNAAAVVSGLRTLRDRPLKAKLVTSLSAKGRAVRADRGPRRHSVCERLVATP